MGTKRISTKIEGAGLNGKGCSPDIDTCFNKVFDLLGCGQVLLLVLG